MFENTALRLDSAPFRVSEFIRKNHRQIAINTIANEIRLEGIAAKMTAKQLSKLTINPTELDIEISIKTHGPTSGREPRPKWSVKPKNKKSLSWVAGGNRFFSKGHFVRGADVKYVLDRGIKKGLAKYRTELKRQTEQFMEATSIGRV